MSSIVTRTKTKPDKSATKGWRKKRVRAKESERRAVAALAERREEETGTGLSRGCGRGLLFCFGDTRLRFRFVTAGRLTANNATSRLPPRVYISIYARRAGLYNNCRFGRFTAGLNRWPWTELPPVDPGFPRLVFIGKIEYIKEQDSYIYNIFMQRTKLSCLFWVIIF